MPASDDSVDAVDGIAPPSDSADAFCRIGHVRQNAFTCRTTRIECSGRRTVWPIAAMSLREGCPSDCSAVSREPAILAFLGVGLGIWF